MMAGLKKIHRYVNDSLDIDTTPGYSNDKSIPFHEFTHPYKIENGLSIKQIIFKPEFEDCVNLFKRVSLGRKENTKASKSMLLVGGTGVGKSSLINTLVNKIFGVTFKDNFRLNIIEKETQGKSQSESQTDWITIYQFYHMPGMTIDYNLAIVDTPGLNDTRGLNFDKKVFERLEMVFKINRFFVDELNCIGIVTPSSATRLTTVQQYIYDGTMKMFGSNVKDIIHIMATFSDGSEPQIKDVLDKAKVCYTDIHLFNNSCIYVSNKQEGKPRYVFREEGWNYLADTTEEFLSILQASIGQSLTQSSKTLESRRILHEKLGILEDRFMRNINKVQNLQLQEDANNNSETITVFDLALRKVEYSQKALNCNTCKVTCHKPCYEKCKLCKKIAKDGNYCLVCECMKSSHSKEKFQYVNVCEEISSSGKKQ
ncbi:unnamed protein product, partial [Meganyctiphanes norvegica]